MAKSKQTPGFTAKTKLSTTDISGETHNVKIQQEYIKNQQERNKLHEKEQEQIDRINKRLEQGYKATATQLKNLEDIRKRYDVLNDTAGSIHTTLKKTATTMSDIRNNTEKSIDAWSSLSAIYKTQKEEVNQLNLKQLGLKSITEEISVKEGLTKKKREQALDIVGLMSDGLRSISTDTAELAELTSDDADKRRLASSRIRESIQLLKDQKEQLAAAGKLNEGSIAQIDEIISAKERELQIAEELSSESKLQKQVNEELHENLKGVQKTIHKAKDAIKMLFSGWRGGLSLVAFGAAQVAEHFAEINKELGVGMTEMVGLKTQATLIGMALGEGAGEAVIDLAKDLGDSHHLTTGMAIDAGLLAANYGLSAKQAAFMSVAFGELSGKSYETGKNVGQYVRDLSLANGIAPAQVMKDIADNTEFFALYSKDGGKNIAEAAVAAGKLGVGLDTVSKVADHLLDYQNSVNDEMEASVLLGRDLNLSKARELAYNGDIAGSMKAALEAAGGIQAYGQMDYYQRQALAKALGVSNAEMQQMVAHEETLNGMHGVGNKLYARGSEILTAMGNSLTGKIFMGSIALITSVGQLNIGLKAMGTSLGGIKKQAFAIAASLFKASTYTKMLTAVKTFGGKAMGMVGGLFGKKSPIEMYQSLRDKGVGAADALKQSGASVKDVIADKTQKSIAAKAKEKAEGGIADKAKETATEGLKDKISPEGVTEGAEKAEQGGDNLAGFKEKMTNLAAGLKELASGKAVLGALALIPIGIGLMGLLPGLPTLWLMGKMSFGNVLLGFENLSLGLAAMGNGSVLMGAGVLALTSIALLMMLPGLATLGLMGLMAPLIIAGFTALVTGLDMLGASSAVAAIGVAILMGVGLAMAFFGAGVMMVGQGVKLASEGIASMVSVLPQLAENLLPLIGMILPIFGLAAAITVLAVSLAMLGTMGMLALPVLAALGAVGAVAGGLMGGGGGGNDKQDEMITLLRSIDSKVGGQPAINLDGKKIIEGQNVNSSRQGSGNK